MTRLLTGLPAILFLALLVTGCRSVPRTSGLKTRNVVLVTIPGLRWQEVFDGADETLLEDQTVTANPERMKVLYWKDTPEKRRQQLMPFLWQEIAEHGQIFGNKTKGSEVKSLNGSNRSFAGYSELLTGIADPDIESHPGDYNIHTNVFEWLNSLPPYRGKVAASANWNRFPWILNTPRSQIPVWTGFVPPEGAPVFEVPELLDVLSRDITPILSGLVFDSFTIHAAEDYIQHNQPRAFYLAFGETEEWASRGYYDRYLVAAKQVDFFIYLLWETCQSMPQYCDQTTFIITTDHGRGDGRNGWRKYGPDVAGSDNLWMAVIGPDTPPLGERENVGTVQQNQIAATVAAFLGEDFHAIIPSSGVPLKEAIGSPQPRP